MTREPEPDLIYTPARRGDVGLLLMFIGPSGSGKTKTALRVATGLAGGRLIGGCDTEHGRMLYYAPRPGEAAHPPDDFDFQHYPLKEPFEPYKFEAAAIASQKAGHAVWICDNFAAEHIGPGGVLDMFEAELQRMVPNNNYERREQMKMAAWIKPKGQHKHMLQRFWQSNFHIILCVQANKKIEMQKDEKTGKFKPVDVGYMPICAEDVPYAMTASFQFDPANPGVPIWYKYFDKIAPLIDLKKPMDEATGERLAAWARGERNPTPASSSAPASKPAPANPAPAKAAPAAETRPETPADPPAETRQETQQETRTEPPAQPNVQPDDANSQPVTPAPDKNETVLSELIAMFEATRERADHFRIVDAKIHQDRIAWFKKTSSKNHLYPRLKAAIEASWARTDPNQQKALV